MNGISARLAAGSGAFFVVAAIVGNQLAASGAPEGTDGPAALAYLQRDPTPVNAAGFVLEILGFAALLVFVGYLYRKLRRAEGADGWVAEVACAAGVAGIAVKLGSIAPIAAGVNRRDELTVELARTLVDLNDAAFVVFGLLFGIFVTAASAASSAYRMVPRWLGWIGVVLGTLAFGAGVVGIVAPDSYNPLAFVGGLVWTLVLSGILTARAAPGPGRPEGAAVQAAAASV